MVNFTFDDLIIGVSTLVILLFGYGLGSYFLYKSIKMKTKLLSILSLSMISVSFAWLPVVLDFFLVLFTNLSSDLLVYIYLTWVQLPISVLLSQYVAAELLLPSKKIYIIYFLEIIGILFLVFLFLDPLNSVNPVGYPVENFYYKISIKINSLPGIFCIVLVLFVFFFSGIGYIYKSFISKPQIKNNFRFLGIGMIFIYLFGILDSIVEGIFLVLIRLGAIVGLFLSYWGLRPRIQKKTLNYDNHIKMITYFLHKPKSTDISGEIEYYSDLLKRPITLFMSFYPEDLKMYKIREIIQKLKIYPEIRDIIYRTYKTDEDMFEFTQNVITKFDVMLVFCSKEAFSSTEVKNQWISALDNNKSIIPVYIKPDYVPNLLKNNEGLLYDLYDFDKTILNLRYLILKAIFSK